MLPLFADASTQLALALGLEHLARSILCGPVFVEFSLKTIFILLLSVVCPINVSRLFPSVLLTARKTQNRLLISDLPVLPSPSSMCLRVPVCVCVCVCGCVCVGGGVVGCVFPIGENAYIYYVIFMFVITV